MNPEIILGPPGTGKTTTLLGLVEEELSRGVPPDRIAFVSFTRRAANEAVERACEKFSLQPKDLPHFRTLHSLCYRWLGLRSDDVMEFKKIQEFADYARIRITGRFSDDGTFSGFEEGDRILFLENLSRVRCESLEETFEQDTDGLDWVRFANIVKQYRQFKKERGLLDYTDMLIEFVKEAPQMNLEVLLTDESQDQSALQWKVVNILAKGARRVVIAGDDDQAIYKWAGADVNQLITLPGSVTVLNQSYRVPRLVQNIAHKIISRVIHRRPKEWAARDEEGEGTRARHLGSIDFTSSKNILVLTRNVYVLRDQVEPFFKSRGLLYDKNGVPSIKPTIRDAIISWERLRRGDSVTVPEVRGIYGLMTSLKGVARGHKELPTMSEDHPPVDLQTLKMKGGLLTEAPWFDALDRIPRGEINYIRSALALKEKFSEKPRIRISTIHSAKGAEAEQVVLLREMGRKTFKEMERGYEDEARCWYVGVTRAIQKLTLVSSQTPQEYDV